jgi:hypothetical protein
MGLTAEIAGWIGASLILLAYGLLSGGRAKSGSTTYQMMNMAGAVGLIANTIWNHAYPSVALNVIWFGIGLYSLARRPRRRD